MQSVAIDYSNNRQHITLPDSMSFKDTDICATKIGDAVVIIPRKRVKELMRQGFNSFSKDMYDNGRNPLISKSVEVI